MVGGSFLRQLERDRDRGRQGRENGQRAMLWTDGQRAEQTAQGEGAISRKGQRYSLLHDTMAATYGGALLLGKSNLAPVGCRQ